MATFLGREMSRQDVLRSTGRVSQIAGARAVELAGGRGGGSRAIEVTTGGGLEFTVLQDKCLDILDMRYRGVNLSFIAKAGATAPQYYNPHNEFPYYFQGGMLATCGLRNVGSAGADGGEELTLHGRIGNAPAENVGVSSRWVGDEYRIDISGEMRESALFKENMLLRRSISTGLGAKSFVLRDRVENETCRSEPLMLLYHINFGFPFLGPALRLLLPAGTKTRPRDEEARMGMGGHRSFEAPIDGYSEQVFYHEFAALPNGDTCALLRNDALGFAVYVKCNRNELPFVAQWKCMASGDYALGIEPATCHVEGRANERKLGSLRMLEPFASAEFTLEIGVLDGPEIEGFVRETNLSFA